MQYLCHRRNRRAGPAGCAPAGGRRPLGHRLGPHARETPGPRARRRARHQSRSLQPRRRASALAGQQVVINLATHIPPTSQFFTPGAWRETDRLRRQAAANLVEAAMVGGAQRFIQESFALTYPDRGDDWITEDTPIHASSYNRGVQAAEASAQRFNTDRSFGIVLRFALLLRPRLAPNAGPDWLRSPRLGAHARLGRELHFVRLAR